MSRCKYFSPNGKPSKLFDGLFDYYKKEAGDDVEAEKRALKAWLAAQSKEFKNVHGDWVTEARSNNDALLQEAKKLSSSIPAIYQKSFNEDVKGTLRDFAEQANTSDIEKANTEKLFGKRLVEIATEMYPDAKVGDRRLITVKTDSNGEPLVENVIKWNNTDKWNTNSLAMAAYYQGKMYDGEKTREEDPDNKFFYLRDYNEFDLRYGRKTVSVRPEKLNPGVYKLGNDYYRISSRGFKKISDLKESPEKLREKFIGEQAIKYLHIEDFFNNKTPMYVYDIKKLDEKDYPGVLAMADYMGNIRITNSDPESKLVTGNHLFDTYIAAIHDYIGRLQGERSRVKGNLKAVNDLTDRIKQQETYLSQLQSNKTVRALVATGTEQLGEAQKYALKDSASFLEITEGMRIAKAWGKLTAMIDLTKEGKSEGQLEVINAGRDLELNAHTLYATLWNKLTQKLIQEASAYNIDLSKMVKDGEFNIKDMNAIGAFAVDVSFSGNPIDQFIAAVRDKTTWESNEEHEAWRVFADRTASEILGKPDADDSFLIEEYDDTLENAEGKPIKIKRQGIITIENREFLNKINDLRSQAQAGIISWKDFYKFERQHYSYELTEEGKKEWEDFKEQVIAEHTTVDENENETIDQDAIDVILRRWNPETFQKSLTDKNTDPNSGGRWFTKTGKNIPVNPKYTALSAQEKKYHKWFSEEYMKAFENSVFDYRVGETDIDSKLQEFSSQARQGLGVRAKYAGEAAVEWMKDTVTVVANSNKSRNTTRTLTDKEHIGVPFKDIVTFLPKEGQKLRPRDILKKFKAASIAYKHKRNIEELVNVINDIANSANREETNNSGISKITRAGNKLLTKEPTAIAARIDYTAKHFLTDKPNAPNETAWDTKPGDRGFSFSQTLDSLNKLTRNRYMAFAPLSAAGNFLMGAVNNLIYASSGRYFSDKELLNAMILMKGAIPKFYSEGVTLGRLSIGGKRAELIAQIMYRHNVISDITEELVYGHSALQKLFALQKGGEFLVQGATALAQMLRQKVTLKDGTKKTFFNMYKLNNENHAIFQEDLLADDEPMKEVSNRQHLFDVIKQVNKKIHGDYSGALTAKKTVWGRLLFLFRTWLPMSVKERFGSEYEDRLLGTQKGRYVSAWQIAKGVIYDAKTKEWKFDKDNAFNLAKTFLKLVPGLNKAIKLSDKVSQVDRDNINMFCREVQLTLMLLLAVTQFRAGAGDDPNEDDKNILRYLTNQGMRLQSELSMYYLPSSYDQIFKSIIPMTQTMIDAEATIVALKNYVVSPDKDEYKKGFRKGHSKAATAVERFLPITRSAETTWSAFSNIYSNQPQHK